MSRKQELETKYELKEGARLGPGSRDDKEGRILNRVVRWTTEGLEYEADPRQAERLLEEIELTGEGVKGVVTPSVKPLQHRILEEKELAEGTVLHELGYTTGMVAKM